MRKIPLVQAWSAEMGMSLTCCCHLNLECEVLPACQECKVYVVSEDPTKKIHQGIIRMIHNRFSSVVLNLFCSAEP